MVTTSSNLEFLAINGQKASKSLLKEKKSFNAEADQTQQVVVRLGEIVGTGSSQGLFESNPVIVTFKGTADDVVVSAEKIRSQEDGEKFNAQPQVSALAAPAVGMMPAASGKATKGKVVVQGENVAEQQLQYWFQQADKETQTRFLNWAKKQK